MIACFVVLKRRQRAAAVRAASRRTLIIKALRALLADGRVNLAGAIVALHALHGHVGLHRDELALKPLVVRRAKADEQQKQQCRRRTGRPRSSLLMSPGHITPRQRNKALALLLVLEGHDIGVSPAGPGGKDGNDGDDGDSSDSNVDCDWFLQDEKLLLVSDLREEQVAKAERHRQSLPAASPISSCNSLGFVVRRLRPASAVTVTNVVSSSRSTPSEHRQFTAAPHPPSATSCVSLDGEAERLLAAKISPFSLFDPRNTCLIRPRCGISPGKADLRREELIQRVFARWAVDVGQRAYPGGTHSYSPPLHDQQVSWPRSSHASSCPC
jgi:hypothetical protein